MGKGGRGASRGSSVSKLSDNRSAAEVKVAGLQIAGQHIDVTDQQKGFDKLPGGGGGVGGQGTYKVPHSYAPRIPRRSKNPAAEAGKQRLARVPNIRQRGVASNTTAKGQDVVAVDNDAHNSLSSDLPRDLSFLRRIKSGKKPTAAGGMISRQPHKPVDVKVGDRGRAAAL